MTWESRALPDASENVGNIPYNAGPPGEAPVMSTSFTKLYCPPLFHILLFYSAYVFGAWFGNWLAVIPGIGITFWPPAGLFLAVLLLSEKIHWGAWLLTGLLAELTANLWLFHNSFAVFIAIYCGNALAAMTGAWLVRRWCEGPVCLDTLKEVIALMVVGAAAAPLVSATIGSATLAAIGKPFFVSWPLWWIGDAAGIAVFAPVTLIAVRSRIAWREGSAARWLEAGVLGLLLAGTAHLFLGGHFPFSYIILPPLVWAAVRFEFKGAIAAILILAAMTVAYIANDLTHFVTATDSRLETQVWAHMFLAVFTLLALVVASLSRQHAQALAELRNTNDALEYLVEERTTELRESETRLRMALEGGQAGAWQVKLEPRRIIWDPGWRHIYGFDENETPSEGKWSARLHPDDASWVKAKIDAALAGTAQGFQHEFRIIHPVHGERWLHDRIYIERDRQGRAIAYGGINFDITERKQAEEHVRFLMREVNHRSKNMLTLVHAIARQTAATEPKDFVAQFEKRVLALSASQDLLIGSGWKGVGLAELVRSQLSHFMDLLDRRIAIKGPSLTIDGAAAQTLGMAIHELSTNAGKYGALSDQHGRVAIAWELLDGENGDRRFAMSWKERGGPRIDRPSRKGFGTTVIDRMSRMTLAADVTLDYASEGFSWKLECPADRVLEGGGSQNPDRSLLPPAATEGPSA